MTEDTKTLRDEFAMALISPLNATLIDASEMVGATEFARQVYELADALMAERATSSPALNEGGR